jgi:beta-fructofuranosidase
MNTVAAHIRQQFATDTHRPHYHFVPPANWMNDPNGLIHWKGRYHLFYQYNPNGPFWGTIHWGHAVSDDLVHWSDLPIALTPGPGGVDQDGCWSGCAVDHDSVPTLIYTGISGDHEGPANQRPCIATSADDDLVVWEKYADNPVIRQSPPDLALTGFRDHCVWREADRWYQIVGSGIRDTGGAALLYRSGDLRQWEYLHPLCTSDQLDPGTLWTGSVWECPQFIVLDGRHYLIFSVWHEGRTHYSVYLTGDYRDNRFFPTGVHKLDFGDHHFYAPQTMIDNQGRHLMWGWIQEGRSREAQQKAGWSGVMSLPRLIKLHPNGLLGYEPVPELQVLRQKHYRFSRLYLTETTPMILHGVNSNCLELLAEVELDVDAVVELTLKMTPDRQELTRLIFNQNTHELWLDRAESSLDTGVDRSPLRGVLPQPTNGKLSIHIFLDRSVIEVFTNGQSCLTGRVYPTRNDSDSIVLMARRGHVQTRSLDIWEMRGIYWI